MLAILMLSVWGLSHIEVRGEHSLQRRSIGGGGAKQMTKALEKSGPHILGYTCRGDPHFHLLAAKQINQYFHHSIGAETYDFHSRYQTSPLLDKLRGDTRQYYVIVVTPTIHLGYSDAILPVVPYYQTLRDAR